MRLFYKHDTTELTAFFRTRPRATIKTTNLRQWHGTICIVKEFLLSEREISPNYTGIFYDFVHRFGSYVKGLPKTKRCNSVAITVSVRIWCICETALKDGRCCSATGALMAFVGSTPTKVEIFI